MGNTMSYSCSYCSKSFPRKWSKDRHEQDGTCIRKSVTADTSAMQEREEFISMIMQKFDSMEKEMQKLRSNIASQANQIAQLNEKQKSYMNITSCTKQGTCNNVMNQVRLNNYGKEDLSHITHSMIQEWALDPRTGVVNYFETKHFDKNKPENNNIMISNIKRKEISVHIDGAWIPKDADTITEEIVIEIMEKLQSGLDWDNCPRQAENDFGEVTGDVRSVTGKLIQKVVYYSLMKRRAQCKINSMARRYL